MEKTMEQATNNGKKKIVIVGAGPGGLTAATQS
jgi:ribulose 1,5-bisphosphate synthetase/thiazole synthase